MTTVFRTSIAQYAIMLANECADSVPRSLVMSKPSSRYLPLPHTREWFIQLRKINLWQATMTEDIVREVGRIEVCSICGEANAPILHDSDPPYMLVRLCND